MRKAKHLPSKKTLALKEIYIRDNPEVAKGIILELRTLLECDHENIVSSYGAFLCSGNVTIALEYMNAGSLAKILAISKQIPEDILGIITVPLLYIETSNPKIFY